MDWDAIDLASAFKRFKEHANFMFGGPLEKKPEAAKCNYLMLWTGDKGREIFSTWNVTEADKKKLDTYFTGFEEYCKPKTNNIYNRYRFKSRRQQDGESFEQFVTELKLLIRDCSYPLDIVDDLIRDHIVFGIQSNEIREKLIREGSDMSLDKCIDLARTHELSQSQCRDMGQPPAAAVDAVRQPLRTRRNTRPNRRTEGGTAHPQQQRRQQQICGNCGQKHQKGNCPAFGLKCHNCAKMNHFAKVCRKKTSNKVHEVSTDCPEFNINMVEHDTISNQAFVEIGIGNAGCFMKMKIDSGASVNAIPLHQYRKLGIKGPLKPSDKRLTAYGGKALEVEGYKQLQCSFKDKKVTADFYIVNTQTSCPILGLETCLALGVMNLVLSVNSSESMTKQTVMEKYGDVFQGIGKLPGVCDIKLKPNAVPVVHPPRKVPVAIRDKLKDELDRMENDQIICKVTEPTEWVNSLVTVQKPNGSLRLCLDPKDLNEAIMRPHYPSKTLDDILPDLTGATVFSKFDARSGYHSLVLTERSSLLTTFNTPFGRYRFLRVPFGCNNSADLFQQKMDECLEHLPGVRTIVDDIVCFGRDQKEHDANLDRLMQRCRKMGIRLNPEKTMVSQTEIPFFGHLLTSNGLKIDPDKVKAIREMPAPTNKSELETVLGMVTYLQRFAPNLADISRPMRQLLANDAEFVWDTMQ